MNISAGPQGIQQMITSGHPIKVGHRSYWRDNEIADFILERCNDEK